LSQYLCFFFEALCYVGLNEPSKVLELYKQDGNVIIDENYLISTAFMMTANMDKAIEKTQISIYITSAQFYITIDNKEKAIDMLSDFNTLVTSGIFPLILTGDMFFDKIDNWLQSFDLGNATPRNSKTIERSILSVIQSPMFEALREFPRYKLIVENLNLHFGG
jgi:hypothetical protein